MGAFDGVFGLAATIRGGFTLTGAGTPVTDTVVASVSASVGSIAGEPGQVVTFTLSALRAAGTLINGKTYTAVSANPSAVRVDSVVGRLVTCSILDLTAGVVVTGSCEGHSATVTVSSTWILDSLLLTPSPVSINVGSSSDLTASARNRFGLSMPIPVVTGSTSASSVAIVGAISGATVPVNGVGPGTASIRVRVGTIVSNAVAISVEAAGVVLVPTSIRVTPATLFPTDGTTDPITARLLDQNGDPIGGAGHVITWSDVLGSGGVFAFPTSTTDSSGVATVAFLVSSDPSISHQVRATSSALVGTSGVIDVQPDVGGGSFGNVRTVDLPVNLLDTDLADTPSSGPVTAVTDASNLQATLDAALPGDVITIAPGALNQQNLVLNPRGAGGIAGQHITVKIAGSFIAEHARLTAADVASYALPKLSAIYGGVSTLSANGPCGKWRFIGLEITVDPSVPSMNTIVNLGGAGNATLADFPSDLIFDRCYIHGHSTLECRRGVTLNSYRTAIIDGMVLEIHSSGFDSQAIWGWNGPGVYKIENNRLEASTEVLGFGGADPVYAGHNPTDIVIRRNHITRPMAWKGGPWLIKNMIELKCGIRVLIERNVIENSWPSAQLGWALVAWSVNQTNTNPTVETAHVTFRLNVIRNCSAGFQLSDGYHDGSVRPFVALHHVAIYHNTFIGMDNPNVVGGGLGVYIGNAIANISFEHNTFFMPTQAMTEIVIAAGTSCANLCIRNNLQGGGTYPLFISGGPWSTITSGDSLFEGNVYGFRDAASFASSYSMPAGNAYPPTENEIGLAGGGAKAYDVTATLADLTLAPSTTYKGFATDGLDPGADQTLVAAGVSGVGGGF